MARTPFQNNQSGFTLIELLVILGVLALVVAIATSSVLSFLPGYRIKAATRDLVSNLQRARSEAIKRNRTCTVTFSDQTIDGITYNYFAWFDTNNDNTFNPGEQVLAVRLSDYHSQVRFDKSLGGGDGLGFTGTSFTFNSRGLCGVQIADAATTANIFLINDKGDQRSISISLTGAVQVNN